MRFMMSSYPGSPSNGANMGQNLLNCEFTANPPSNALASLFRVVSWSPANTAYTASAKAIQEQFRTPTNIEQFRMPTDLNAFFGQLPRNDSTIDGCPELLLMDHIPDKYQHLVRYYGYYSNRPRWVRITPG